MASGGRWKARDTLSDAVLALGCEPDAGIMLASADFTVDPVFGGVSGTEVQRVDLSDDEMEKLMQLCAYDGLEQVTSLLDFASEQGVDTGDVEDAIYTMMAGLEG